MASEEVVHIHCAQPIGDEEITTVTIRIRVPMPNITDSDDWQKAYRDMYTKEATALADALCYSLPGGTIDALLVKLLDAKRTLFSVPLYLRPQTDEVSSG